MIGLVAICIAGSYAHLSADAAPQYRSSASVEFFYDDLAPFGRWVDHPIYGTVWVPASHEPGWQPYVEGRWVLTTDYGWYWDSDEEFGWATYHYGRWAFTAEYGWVWIPDDVWGPAWVDWRYGDSQVGWAPMPPEYAWRDNTLVAARLDLGSPRFANTWVFVSDRDFVRGNVRSHRLPRTSNSVSLRSSTRVTAYSYVGGRIVNRSIDPARISAAIKVRIDPVRIGIAQSLEGRAKIKASGSIPVYRPRIVAKSKLKLDLPTDYSTGSDVESQIKTRGRVDVDPPASIEPPVDATVSGSAGGVLDRPLGGGLGVGGGIGIGGARLGR
jgi:hypothetical protein